MKLTWDETKRQATLREAMTRKTLEETLRKVIREELHPATRF